MPSMLLDRRKSSLNKQRKEGGKKKRKGGCSPLELYSRGWGSVDLAQQGQAGPGPQKGNPRRTASKLRSNTPRSSPRQGGSAARIKGAWAGRPSKRGGAHRRIDKRLTILIDRRARQKRGTCHRAVQKDKESGGANEKGGGKREKPKPLRRAKQSRGAESWPVLPNKRRSKKWGERKGKEQELRIRPDTHGETWPRVQRK